MAGTPALAVGGASIDPVVAAPAATAPVAEAAPGSPDRPEHAGQAEANTGFPGFRSYSRLSAYREHAPLAYFSLGSLAVGGLFYGIQASLEGAGSNRINGDGTRMDMAVGAAGLTALAAGAAYFYYVLRGSDGAEEPAHPWAGSIRGGIGPDGGLAASVTLPLSSLSP
jgi:hypothetical protein